VFDKLFSQLNLGLNHYSFGLDFENTLGLLFICLLLNSKPMKKINSIGWDVLKETYIVDIII